jgi:hypothetical protein
MGERFSLDSIIQAEVKKAIDAQVPKPSPGGGLLDGITLQDITKFISEITKLKTQMAQLTPQPLTPGPSPPAHNPQATPAPAPALNPNAVYNGVLQGIDMIVPALGDLRLSELKAYMTENKDAVIALIGSSLK